MVRIFMICSRRMDITPWAYNAPSECSKRDGHFADKLISIAYYGKDVLGLCQWIQHGACNSSLPKWGNYILQDLVCLP